MWRLASGSKLNLHAYSTREKMFFTNFTGSKFGSKNISITNSAKFSTEKIHIHILVETIIYMSTTLISTWASCLTSYFVFCRFKSPTKNIPYSATFRNYFHFFATSMLVTLSSTKNPKILINSFLKLPTSL